MTVPKGKLFQLALDCKKMVPKSKKERNHKTVKVSGKHYDEGRAINLSFSLDMYSQSVFDSYRHNEPSAQLSFVDDMQNEEFYVEPFESEETTIQTNYEEVSDDDPLLDKVVRPSGRDEEASSPVKEEPNNGIQTHKQEPERSEENIPVNINEKQKKPTYSSKSDTTPEDKQADEEQHEISNDEFAEDIKAILQGQKVFDPDKKQTVKKGESPSNELLKQSGRKNAPPRSKPVEEDEELEPSKNEHKIFEKIAQSMKYANSYDLGSIAMEKKFDQMESDLEKEEIRTITNKKNIEDAEVVSEESRQRKEDIKKEVSSPKYNSEALLTIENGGKVVGEGQLQVGDLLLVTSTPTDSDKGKCNAALFVGDGSVISGEQSFKKKSLVDSIGGNSVVVLRHKNPSAQAVQSIMENVNKNSEVTDNHDSVLEISYPPLEIHSSICELASENDRAKCQSFKGRVDLGTADNERFFIPYKLAKLIESSGLNLLDAEISNIAADAEIKAKHNGLWQYAGHLKLKI